MFPVLIMLKNITHELIFVVIWLLDDHLVFVDLLWSLLLILISWIFWGNQFIKISSSGWPSSWFFRWLSPTLRCIFPQYFQKTTKIDQHEKISSISLKNIWSTSLLGMLWNWTAFCAYYVVYLPKNNNATVELRCEIYKNWMGVSL